jgi:5'-methylthioadenosine phosphorylase
MDKAIIGGTGVYDVSGNCYSKNVNTKYGDVNVDIVEINGEEIVFLARHGKGHGVPPHLVNYRANMMALKELGIKYVYATAAVGSCNENYVPGDVVVIKDFMDFTKSRPITYYEGGDEGVIHTDMSEPYCKSLISKFYEVSKDMGIEIKGEAVYACTEGPRFETASEIRMYKTLGGDVVGMTNVPEVILAKELGMCYAAVGIITNWCTGVKGEDIALHDIQGAMSKNKENITNAFISIFAGELEQNSCKCDKSTMVL